MPDRPLDRLEARYFNRELHLPIHHTSPSQGPFNRLPQFRGSLQYDRPFSNAYSTLPGPRLEPISGHASYETTHMSPANVDNSPASIVHSHPSSTPRQSFQKQSTPSPKRRRLHLNPPLHAADPSSIVVADMQNESDALQILALASGQTVQQARPKRPDRPRSASTFQPLSRDARDLADFPLVKLGIVNESQVTVLTERFFRFHHHFFVSPGTDGKLTVSLWFLRP